MACVRACYDAGAAGGDDDGGSPADVAARQFGAMRLLQQTSALGRWIVYDANPSVQEHMLGDLVKYDKSASTHESPGATAPSTPACYSCLSWSPSSSFTAALSRSSVSSVTVANAHVRVVVVVSTGLLADMRGVVKCFTESAAARKTLFSEKPEIMGMFTQSAKGISRGLANTGA